MATIDTSSDLARLRGYRRGDDEPFVEATPEPQAFDVRSREVFNDWDDPTKRAPLVLNHRNFRDVTDTVTVFNLSMPDWKWIIAFIISATIGGVFLQGSIIYLVLTGPGVWGNNNTVAWGWPIVNFVFWVGIGHAGTLISAILFLLRQDWRTSINRFAEAMTIFAVMCAGIYPGLHVGRPWLAYWLFPIPNQMAMWPQFRSPLDVGRLRGLDLRQRVGAVLVHRHGPRPGHPPRPLPEPHRAGRLRRAQPRLERVEPPLVPLRAHVPAAGRPLHAAGALGPLGRVVRLRVSQLAGWHTTIFPPYFVAGAVFGGFAMVLTLAIPAREWFGLKGLITRRHIDNMCKVMLTTGLIVAYSYLMEYFIAWYSGQIGERFTFFNRPFGNYSWAAITMISCNVIFPQLLWIKKFRQNLYIVLFCAMCANIGMWFERFVIIITSLTRDNGLPSSWADYSPTWVDIAMFFGTFGFFLQNMLLFVKFGPIIAIAEIKSVMPQAHRGHGKHDNEDPTEHDAVESAEFQSGYRPAGI